MFVNLQAEELKRLQKDYFKHFKSFDAEIYLSDPDEFPMFEYGFVQRLCIDQNAPLTWNLFVKNSAVLSLEDLDSKSATADSYSVWHKSRAKRLERSECCNFLMNLEDDRHPFLRRFLSNTNRHGGTLSNEVCGSLGLQMSRRTLFRDKNAVCNDYRKKINEIIHHRVFHCSWPTVTVPTAVTVPGTVTENNPPAVKAPESVPVSDEPTYGVTCGCDDYTRQHLNCRESAALTASCKPDVVTETDAVKLEKAVKRGKEHRWGVAMLSTTGHPAPVVVPNMHFDNANDECAVFTAGKISEMVAVIAGGDFLSSLFDIKQTGEGGKNWTKDDFLGSRGELTKSSIEAARRGSFDYASEDAKARADRWKNSCIIGISSPNPIHSFWDTVRVMLLVVTNPVVLKLASQNFIINMKGDNPFTLMGYEICLIGRLHGSKTLGDLLYYVDDSDKKLIPLVAHEMGITVEQAVEKVTQVCTQNLLFHGPGQLHHMINNCVKLVQSWFFLFTKIAKDVLGEKWVLIFNVKPATAQLLVWTLWTAYLECREYVHAILLEVMCHNRFDAAALNHMLEFTLPMCVAPYNIHVRNNLGKGFFENLRHMYAFKYCTEERQNYQYASLHSAAMLDEIRSKCPDLYQYIIDHPIEQDEGDFEGGIFGTICRKLISWQKDEDAIKFVLYECFMRATSTHRAVDAAARPGGQGKAKGGMEKDMGGAITKCMLTLQQLALKICSSDAPSVDKTKRCATGTSTTSINIPAFVAADNKPAVFNADKIGSPAFVFSWRYPVLFLNYNPHAVESWQHRAANGCQGCGSVEPAQGVPRCLALVGVPVHARGCGHVICATGDRKSCWMCSKMVRHDALKKLRTRMNHFNRFILTADTLKTKGYRLASGDMYHGPKGPGGTPGLTVAMFDQMTVSKTWTNEKLRDELRRLVLVVSGTADVLKVRLRAALVKLAASEPAPKTPAVANADDDGVAIDDDDGSVSDDLEVDTHDQSDSDHDSGDDDHEMVDGDAVVDEHVDGDAPLGKDSQAFKSEAVKREALVSDFKSTFQHLRPTIKTILLMKPIAAVVNLSSMSLSPPDPPIPISPSDEPNVSPNKKSKPSEPVDAH